MAGSAPTTERLRAMDHMREMPESERITRLRGLMGRLIDIEMNQFASPDMDYSIKISCTSRFEQVIASRLLVDGIDGLIGRSDLEETFRKLNVTEEELQNLVQLRDAIKTISRFL